MTKLSLLIAAVLFLIVGIVVFLSRRAEVSLDPTLAALTQVTGWHEEYEGPGAPSGSWVNRSSDTFCVLGEHLVEDDTQPSSAPPHREYFYTPKSIYFHTPEGWVKLGGTRSGEACSAYLDGIGPALPVKMLFAGAKVRLGEDRMVGSESCRDYHVKGPWSEFIMCVNEDDHLPRQIETSFLKDEKGEFVKPVRATYSRWNQVTAADLPADAPKD